MLIGASFPFAAPTYKRFMPPLLSFAAISITHTFLSIRFYIHPLPFVYLRFRDVVQALFFTLYLKLLRIAAPTTKVLLHTH
ncbi:hypothetical protein FA15DRAFT_415679 [Coprinopsis marcescibilis]|uniref:Uncharacterized protein n=1 Tax=Coprinopsis marcescibilis TaxID=230819 RepID=A0A5C3L889_COPMA|nr:hypothetical protein FA15DRAFT_415679 [Coprinopsis marcescibilis]